MKERFFPIILGSDENAYGDVRLFREAYGIRPLLVCRKLLIPTLYSKLFDYRLVPDFDREEVFVPALLAILKEYAARYEKLLVVPCSDYYAALMAKHYDAFEGLVANAFVSEALLERFETKDKFYALCDACGLDYPKTLVVEKEARMTALERLPFAFPIVLKPENSNAYEYLHLQFEGKKKVYFLNTPEEYQTVAEALDRVGYTGKLILQEYIEGGDEAMRVVNSFSDNEGRVRVSVMGQPLLEEYAPYTLGNYAAILPRYDEALYRKIEAFLNKIGYRGFSNIDMKYDAKTGRYLMFEINPRLGRSSFFVRAAGVNMMEELTKSVVFGQEHEVVFGQEGSLWSNVPMGVLKKYVRNRALKQEIREKAKDCLYTLWGEGDFSLKRFYRIQRFYLSHYKNYRKYYFQK